MHTVQYIRRRQACWLERKKAFSQAMRATQNAAVGARSDGRPHVQTDQPGGSCLKASGKREARLRTGDYSCSHVFVHRARVSCSARLARAS